MQEALPREYVPQFVQEAHQRSRAVLLSFWKPLDEQLHSHWAAGRVNLWGGQGRRQEQGRGERGREREKKGAERRWGRERQRGQKRGGGGEEKNERGRKGRW